MIKTLHQAMKMDREKFRVPRSVQQAIPIQRIWPDGIFQSGTKFSKSFRFSDINYAIASKEDKTEMFLDYSELLNALDSGASAKITLNNRRINKEEFESSLLLPMKEDGLDEYRKEYNEMLLSKVSGTNNSIYQERYLTVSVHKKNIDEARTYFARVGTDIVTHLSKLSSVGEELDAEQRLQIFRDFFQADQPQCFPFDMKAFAKKGSSFKDWICPQSMEFSKDCFKINERFGRVLYMQDYASYVKDDMISELCDLSRDLMLSIDILPVPTDEAVREIQNRLLGVETNVTNWQRRQNANNNFSAIVPYDMELQRKETKEMLDDLTTRDQRMMFGILTMGESIACTSLKEAFRHYQRFCKNSPQMVPSLEFSLHHAENPLYNEGEYPLMTGDKGKELLSLVPYYANHPLVQEAVKELETLENQQKKQKKRGMER